jgi:hypothetical protein
MASLEEAFIMVKKELQFVEVLLKPFFLLVANAFAVCPCTIFVILILFFVFLCLKSYVAPLIELSFQLGSVLVFIKNLVVNVPFGIMITVGEILGLIVLLLLGPLFNDLQAIKSLWLGLVVLAI